MRSKELCADIAAMCRSQAKRAANSNTAAVLRSLAEHYEAEARRLKRDAIHAKAGRDRNEGIA
jgi:hypothetical protein